jgi:DNA-binding response OmpR family regulator
MSGEPSRILIVDDDEAARYVKSRVLRGEGYAVSEASLGRDALAIAAAEKPHLTLLDVKLPDVSGIEVCREIKSRFPQVIVLQTSAAFTGAADRTRALDGGADSYLVEPIEPDELIATVRALLRMRAAEQEARRINRNLEELVVERTRALADSNRRLASEITDRRQAEAALWHTQKLDLIGQLTGGIAHDFNNLLMVISGNLELIHEAFDAGAKLCSANWPNCGDSSTVPKQRPSTPPRSHSNSLPSHGAARSRRRPYAPSIYWRSRRAFCGAQPVRQSRSLLPAHRIYGIAGSIRFNSRLRS